MARQQQPLVQAHYVIGELAQQTGSSYDEARDAYEHEVDELAQQAKVKTFVPVFARKRARETLRRRHH
jgi:hypothetical protein